MNKIALKGNIVLPDKVLSGGWVLIEGEKIAGVYAPRENLPEDEVLTFDYGENTIAPGLIDIHIHGALGKDVMDGEVGSLQKIALHQAKCGVTGFVPTTMSAPLDSILRAVDTVKKASSLRLDAEILGIHLEGPFLSLKERGAQDSQFIKGIKEEDIRLLEKASRGLKKIITIAPETENNMSFIPWFKEKGFVVSIGHSDASYEIAVRSFKAGISHAAHFFNGMSGYQGREPGVIGAVLDSDQVSAEVIADGIHVHPSGLRLTVRQKGKEKVCLITDSIKAVGLGDGVYQMGSLEIVVKGGESRLKKDGCLAGSVLTLNRAVKNIIDWTGISINEGINTASFNPARLIGVDKETGSVQKGKYANLAVFDEEFSVVDTILRGKSLLKNKF